MTTGTGRDATWLRRWAAEQLSVPETANVAEARTALLRCLPECDFVPPPPWLRAVAILAGRQLPGAGGRAGEAAVWHEEAQRLRDEVESFAGQFWTFPVVERRRRWEQLRGECAEVPALGARLKELERGLDVGSSPPNPDAPRVAELVERLQELLVVRPPERAAQRRALLRTAAGGWQAEANRVRKEYPAVAALEPALVAELARGASRQQERARMVQDLFRPRRRRRVVENTAPAPEGPKFGYGWVLVVVIALGVMRVGIGGLSRNSAPPKSPLPPPSLLQDHIQWGPLPEPVRDSLRATKRVDLPEDLRKRLEELDRKDRELRDMLSSPRSTGSGRP